jgi:parallel beta-helix repeat protein
MKKELIGIFVCMLLVGSVLPVAGNVLVDKSPISIYNGNTLYVGGDGPGNYSSIQEAINDALDEDTIFVYNGRYNENLRIDKSIRMVGNDKFTTLIDGFENEEEGIDVVYITADEVTIQGFTIHNSYKEAAGIIYAHCGIEIISNNNRIINNIIKDNFYGIHINGLIPGIALKNNIIENNEIDHNVYAIEISKGQNNIITNNSIFIDHNVYAIEISKGQNNIITNNSIFKNEIGIELAYQSGKNTQITRNTISENKRGVGISGADKATVQRNSIFNNEQGIFVGYFSEDVKIYENNIYDNEENAYIESDTLDYLLNWKTLEWDRNYWGIQNQEQVRIPGIFFFVAINLFFINFLGYDKLLAIPIYKVDSNPVNEPYYIGV